MSDTSDTQATSVALVTGGASGIGAGVARRLRERGTEVMVADVDESAGRALADEIDAGFVRCDVRDLEANREAVRACVERFGGLDIAILNAGVTSGMGLDDDFDLDRYRHVMGVNLDGVVFGAVAALPALRARGGGQIVATSSLAGLTAVPFDPLYVANKHAVVGLIRSLGLSHGPQGIRVNAVCPGFADTPLISGAHELLEGAGFPILTVDEVVAAFEAVIDGQGSGECWYVQAGRPSEPFGFRRVPGPRVDGPSDAPAPVAAD
jgi:NAD(P)-dependent dehydrogenase (short-subunit alcohol dehydrogenase family)